MLSIAYEVTVYSSLLRPQMVAKNLIEALQTHTFRLFLLIVANLRPAPDALDQEGLLSFS